MGMFDNVVVLDETLRCPHGHGLDGFQTKSFEDPSMAVYLFDGPHLYRVARGPFSDDSRSSGEHWQLDGEVAVFTRRHAVEGIAPPGEVVFYTSCGECAPVLIHNDRPALWGDLVGERQLWVEFRAILVPGEPRRIERTSETRDDLVTELRDEGLRVLRDDEPLAVAHHEIRAARDAEPRRRGGRRWRSGGTLAHPGASRPRGEQAPG